MAKAAKLMHYLTFFCILLLSLCTKTTEAQSMAGVTGRPDTSYTSYSAYTNTLKTHPDIILVPELHEAGIKEVKNSIYCKSSQRPLLIDAFYPAKKTSRKRTAILIIHGGGWRSGNRGQHYPLAQYLAKLGYACFTPEYRLSTEALYPAAVYDLKAAIIWVKANSKKYDVDTARVVALGFSAGGELAAFLGATNGNKSFDGETCADGASSLVQAIVDIDGTLSFVHPESGEGNDSRSTSAATYWFGYPKKENPVLWEQASPLYHAGKSTPPTLFINSAVDRMHAGREDYINVLKKFNTYTEVRQFEGSPHSFCLFHPWFQPTVNYIDKFLQQVFK